GTRWRRSASPGRSLAVSACRDAIGAVYVEPCTNYFDRPTTWPGWPTLPMSRSPFPGVLVMGVLFVVAVMWWRGCPESSPSLSGSGLPGSPSEHHERGGQIVASSRAELRSFNRLVSSDQTTEA